VPAILQVGAYRKDLCPWQIGVCNYQVDACSVGWCMQFYNLVLVARIGILGILVSTIRKWVLVMTGWWMQSCKLVLAIGMGVPHMLELVNLRMD